MWGALLSGLAAAFIPGLYSAVPSRIGGERGTCYGLPGNRKGRGMASKGISWRSSVGINGVNFLLAEVVAVIGPFLGTFLKQKGWSYDRIGLVIALGGLGTLLAQIPAGVISDRIESRRLLLAGVSLLVGGSLALLPMLSESISGVALIQFLSGMGNAFFVPLLAALALSLAGHRAFDRMMGINQSWNHAGNIIAALLAIMLVQWFGVVSIFYVMAAVSVVAASSLWLIDPRELNPHLSGGGEQKADPQAQHIRHILHEVRDLLRDRRILALVVAVALFHMANAPVMPLLGLYLKELGGGDEQIAQVVLVAQVIMIPMALLAGRFCGSLGRKPVFALAFFVLPLRIFLYSITTDPQWLLAIQALDGIAAGIYGVVIALMCSDLTVGKQGFNTLLGIMQTALAVGGVVGPLLQGYLTLYLGFPLTFLCFAGIAALGAVVFLWKVPETYTPDAK